MRTGSSMDRGYPAAPPRSAPFTPGEGRLRQPELDAARRPRLEATRRVEPLGDDDLLLARGEIGPGRELEPAVRLPRAEVELQSAVVAVAGVDGPVPAGLTLRQLVPDGGAVVGDDALWRGGDRSRPWRRDVHQRGLHGHRGGWRRHRGRGDPLRGRGDGQEAGGSRREEAAIGS